MKWNVTTSGQSEMNKVQKPVLPCYEEETAALAQLLRIPAGAGGRLQYFWCDLRLKTRVSLALSRLQTPNGKLQARAMFLQSLVASYSKQQALESLVAELQFRGFVKRVADSTPCLHNIVFLHPNLTPNSRYVSAQQILKHQNF